MTRLTQDIADRFAALTLSHLGRQYPYKMDLTYQGPEDARIPADLLDLYEKQRARYGIGASLLRGGVSLAAGVALGAADLDRVRAADPNAVLICPESSAILVRTAESGL